MVRTGRRKQGAGAETREDPRAANDSPVSKSPWEWPAGRTRVPGNADGTQWGRGCPVGAWHTMPLRGREAPQDRDSFRNKMLGKGGAQPPPPACCLLAVEALLPGEHNVPTQRGTRVVEELDHKHTKDGRAIHGQRGHYREHTHG